MFGILNRRRLLEAIEPLQDALLELVSEAPPSEEPPSADPVARSRRLARKAAARAAVTSGALSLPVGPLGIATILPDLLTVWRIQRQLAADIAAAFGKEASLTREQMIYCLFRHAASQAARDLLVRMGERTIVRDASVFAIRQILRTVGVRVSEQLAGRALSRFLPVMGALGVGGYSYYDTLKVSRTAERLFSPGFGLSPLDSPLPPSP